MEEVGDLFVSLAALPNSIPAVGMSLYASGMNAGRVSDSAGGVLPRRLLLPRWPIVAYEAGTCHSSD